ncbi:hypothetical protein OCF43_26280 [Bacillus cereus]|nr:hypothetical protein [Bacillus cereus]
MFYKPEDDVLGGSIKAKTERMLRSQKLLDFCIVEETEETARIKVTEEKGVFEFILKNNEFYVVTDEKCPHCGGELIYKSGPYKENTSEVTSEDCEKLIKILNGDSIICYRQCKIAREKEMSVNID